MTEFAGVVPFSDGFHPGRDRAVLEGVLPSGAAAFADGQAALVLSQSIYTPEDRFEQQPRLACGGRMRLLFSGRLDNRAELACKLGLDPRGWPDSRLLAAALERWDAGAAPHLIGDFAFAAWDQQARRLLLVVDQSAHRAIYFHRGADFVAFATALRPLLALPRVPRALDEDALALRLADGRDDQETTIWQGIRRVPAGGRVILDPSGTVVERWWQLDPTRRIHLPRDEDYVEAARALLDEAVRCRLRATGPMVSELTAGLDSSGVVATAAPMLLPGSLDTVTMLPGPAAPPASSRHYMSEEPGVLRIAARYPNLRPHFLHGRPDTKAFVEEPGFFLSAGVPARCPVAGAWSRPLLSEMQRLGATVCLSGGGGNLGLSWDGQWAAEDALHEGRWLGYAAAIRNVAAAERQSLLRTAWRRGLGRRMPAFVRRLLGRPGRTDHFLRYNPVNPQLAADLRLAERLPSDALGFGDDLRDSRSLRARLIARRGQTMAWAHAMRVMHGIELRTPLVDVRLLEFCLAIPVSQYLRGGTMRWLARRVLADRLPPEVVQEHRIGAQDTEWFDRLAHHRAEYEEAVERIAASPLARRVLDVPRLQRMVSEWPADRAAAAACDVDYKAALQRGVHFGEFLRWAEGGNT